MICSASTQVVNWKEDAHSITEQKDTAMKRLMSYEKVLDAPTRVPINQAPDHSPSLQLFSKRKSPFELSRLTINSRRQRAAALKIGHLKIKVQHTGTSLTTLETHPIPSPLTREDIIHGFYTRQNTGIECGHDLRRP